MTVRAEAMRGAGLDLRPVGHVIGLLITLMAAAMVLPLLADLGARNGQHAGFLTAGVLTAVAGVTLTLACAGRRGRGLNVQQIFLLTTGAWMVLPVFGGLPFVLGAPGVSFTDAYFEAMSGFTTTGSTVFSGIDALPEGTKLWRGLMQWFGGIGIIVVALAFLPEMRVGGMQFFRSEAFDTQGKILPRAGQIAATVSIIYVVLTGLCFLAYSWTGMGELDAAVHAMTTLATGGFSNTDASFAAYRGAAEYVAASFMILAALPFVLYIRAAAGGIRPLLRDPQVRGFVGFVAVTVAALTLWQMANDATAAEPAFRSSLFNAVSITTGTGYASADYQLWGSFAVAVFFLIGLVGGCAGSTSCSVKIFRYQILLAAISMQIRRIQSPHGLFNLRYAGRPVEDDVINSVIAFFVLFLVTMAAVAVGLSLMGLDPVTAISGAATAVGNIGPGLGPVIGPAGNFAPLPDAAKWLLAAAMLVGRLEVLSVYVIFTAAFWRR